MNGDTGMRVGWVMSGHAVGSALQHRPGDVARGVPAGNVFDELSGYFWPSMRIQVVFSSVYLSNACNDLSRPLPLCL